MTAPSGEASAAVASCAASCAASCDASCAIAASVTALLLEPHAHSRDSTRARLFMGPRLSRAQTYGAVIFGNAHVVDVSGLTLVSGSDSFASALTSSFSAWPPTA